MTELEERNILKELSEDDIVALCEVITPKIIRTYFKDSPKGYQQLNGRVYINKITDSDAISIVRRNRSHPFITSFITNSIERINESASQKIKEHEENSEDIGTALINMLAESPFNENVALYFKITDKEYAPEFVQSVKYAVELKLRLSDTQDRVESNSEIEKGNQNLNIEIEELKTKNNNLVNSLEAVNVKYNETLSQLDAANSEIEELKAELNSHSNVEEEKAVVNFTNPDYKYTSLCKVFYNQFKGFHMIKRLADINNDGIITCFYPNEEMPRRYANRDMLYLSKWDQQVENFVGVWDWNATPNNHNSELDHIDSKFNSFAYPVEIIKLGVNNMTELIEKIKDGINVRPGNTRFMCSFETESGFVGLLLDEKSSIVSNNTLKLNDNAASLEKYKFAENDLITIENRTYFKSLNLTCKVGIEKLADIADMVKKRIISNISWASFKELGLTNKAFNTVKEFLNSIPTKSLYIDISESCNCSQDEAEEAVNNFIASANSYLTGTSEEQIALKSAIEQSPELFERGIKLLSQDWESDNAARIESENRKFEELSKRNSDLKSELEKINSEIEKMQKYSGDVEKMVAEKIAAAKENAATFVSEMAFFAPMQSISSEGNTNFIECGHKIETDELCRYHHGDLPRLLNNISDNLLYYAGVCDKFTYELSAFLYSSYISQKPLLLAGPNGRGIADAFSCALFSKTAAYVDCSAPYSSDRIAEIENIAEDIIVIDNIFNGAWVNAIIRLLENAKKHYILIHPFAEDLLIEPRGLTNYIVPVLTEVIIDKTISNDFNNFVGGLACDDFDKPNLKEERKIYLRLLKSGKLFKSKMRTLLTLTHSLTGEENQTFDELVGVFPYMYISGNSQLLTDTFCNEADETVKEFLGAEDE